MWIVRIALRRPYTFIVAALVAGALPVPPWLLALLLTAVLMVVWLVAIGRFLRAGAWSEAQAEADAEQVHEGQGRVAT